MTKSRERNKYIIFWETNNRMLPPDSQERILIYGALLKMIEAEPSVVLCGRCEGVMKEGRMRYNGFALFEQIEETVDDFCNRYMKYLNITGKHKYKDIQQMRECLQTWER